GYLFAGDVLLNESGMQNHPLTPMTGIDSPVVGILRMSNGPVKGVRLCAADAAAGGGSLLHALSGARAKPAATTAPELRKSRRLAMSVLALGSVRIRGWGEAKGRASRCRAQVLGGELRGDRVSGLKGPPTKARGPSSDFVERPSGPTRKLHRPRNPRPTAAHRLNARRAFPANASMQPDCAPSPR
ncbi:MAG: hypothetical protein ACREP7_11265, partial [Lysobacter sp.]